MFLSAMFLIVLQINSLLHEARSLETKMPANCMHQTFCTEKSDEYPQEIFDELLGQIDMKNTNVQVIEVEQREGEYEEDGCYFGLMGNKIYEIIDTNGVLRYVAQVNRTFIQELDIKVCLNPGRTNYIKFHGSINEPEIISCVQVTLDYNFLVLNQDKNGLELAQAKGGIPVSCMCELLQTYHSNRLETMTDDYSNW